jgi:octaheme c-type cytochrome (tetrathionate reductase family)
MRLLILLFLFAWLFPVFAQDHTENVSGPFENSKEVTEECLMCHDDVGEQVLQSNHWNYLSSNIALVDYTKSETGNKVSINNFCLAVPGEGSKCITCHLPFSGIDKGFEFNTAENIDCLVCHDQTGNYIEVKFKTKSDTSEIDFLSMAQSVAKPTDNNCGTCHFNEIGGVKVKSGAMDRSLFNPTEEIDYHLGGLGFGCGDCHESSDHNISPVSEEGISPVACENCHSDEPHEKQLLNNHYSAVACQTCHIPTYSRTEASIVQWDWSQAGKKVEVTSNEFGLSNYYVDKGELVWAKNIQPEYYWNNGNYTYYELGQEVTNKNEVDLNKPAGKISDANSKISPFKVVKYKQPFDPENKYLIIPKLSGESGYQNTLDWVTASQEGMSLVNLNFSGEVGFIDSKMYWPINHMVISSDNALKCTSCHGKGGEGLLNWKALGYPDDPMKKGGRVKNKLVKE